MRWPADTRLDATTASTEQSRKPHRHPAEQCRDLMRPPVLDVESPAAGRAIRPHNRMIAGLRGNHRLLNARQELLCLGQRQPQIRDDAKVVGPADLITSTLRARLSVPVSTNRKTHAIHDPQPAMTRPVISLPSPSPQSLDTAVQDGFSIADCNAAQRASYANTLATFSKLTWLPIKTSDEFRAPS
jgi:hypothetical protein